MSRQIIRQPDGLYALWSTITDSIILIDATADDLKHIFIQEEAAKIRKLVDAVVEGLYKGEKPYYQFTISWEEATIQRSPERGKDITFFLEEARKKGVMPDDWFTFHERSCGTEYRGCNPTLCRKNWYEEHGEWLGPKWL